MPKIQGVGPGAHLGMCWNDETFAELIPIEEAAAQQKLFISSSGHGMGADELVDWLLKKRAWVNPWTNEAFTPEDIRAIRDWKQPVTRRLMELDDAAVAHLMLARQEQMAGRHAAAARHREEADQLAPDRRFLRDYDAWVPPLATPRDQPPVAVAGAEAVVQPPPAPLSAPSAQPARRGVLGLFGRRGTGAAMSQQAAVRRVPQATWEALRRFAAALKDDASEDDMPSVQALWVWQAHAAAQPAAVLTQIDALVRVFDAPFSERWKAAFDPNYPVSFAACSLRDLGHELDRVLARLTS